MNYPKTLNCHPRGWYFKDEKSLVSTWTGPFDTEEEAVSTAKMLVSGKQKTIIVVEMVEVFQTVVPQKK